MLPRLLACLFVICTFASYSAISQSSPAIAPLAKLFDSSEPLNLELSGNIRELLNDRGDISSYHPLRLTYNTDSATVTFNARLKTRGHFRKSKSNCQYPPLWINVSKKEQTRSSLFYDQDKIKLVMPCQGDDYVIREWLVYRLYNLVSPKSFGARLVKLTLDDLVAKKKTSFYAMLLEDEAAMANRNKLIPVNKTMVRPERIEMDCFLTMALFQYLIGNTDWSVQYLQNIKLIAKDSASTPFTVPYDFDHSGIVNAPYAHPAEELMLASVKDRRYRGYCLKDMKWFTSTVALFNELKPQIYKLYNDCALLDARYLKAVIKYIDGFYATINNPKTFQKEISYPCDPNGTGNVVIKGLRTE